MSANERRGIRQDHRADNWIVHSIVTMDSETRKGAIIGGLSSAAAIAALYAGAWLFGMGVWW